MAAREAFAPHLRAFDEYAQTLPDAASRLRGVAAFAPVDVTPRRASLVIEPKDAKVELDGVPAKAKDGVVELRGALGKVIKVKLTKGKQEYEEDVAITETGAYPVKVVIPPPGAPKPSGSASAGAAAPRPTSTATRTNFE